MKLGLLLLVFTLGCGERSGLIENQILPDLDKQEDSKFSINLVSFRLDPSFPHLSQTYWLASKDPDFNGAFQYIFNLEESTFSLFQNGVKKDEGAFNCQVFAAGTCTIFQFNEFSFWQRPAIFKLQRFTVESIETGDSRIIPFVRGFWPSYSSVQTSPDGNPVQVESVMSAYVSSDTPLQYLKLGDMSIPLQGVLPHPIFLYTPTCTRLDEASNAKRVNCQFTQLLNGEVEVRQWLVTEL